MNSASSGYYLIFCMFYAQGQAHIWEQKYWMFRHGNLKLNFHEKLANFKDNKNFIVHFIKTPYDMSDIKKKKGVNPQQIILNLCINSMPKIFQNPIKEKLP